MEASVEARRMRATSGGEKNVEIVCGVLRPAGVIASCEK